MSDRPELPRIPGALLRYTSPERMMQLPRADYDELSKLEHGLYLCKSPMADEEEDMDIVWNLPFIDNFIVLGVLNDGPNRVTIVHKNLEPPDGRERTSALKMTDHLRRNCDIRYGEWLDNTFEFDKAEAT